MKILIPKLVIAVARIIGELCLVGLLFFGIYYAHKHQYLEAIECYAFILASRALVGYPTK